MKKFMMLFEKVDGKEILKRYIRAHVLIFALVITLFLGFSEKSLEIVRLAVNNRVLNKLRKKYKPTALHLKNSYSQDLAHESSRKVWICWLQGIENAPDIVKFCYQSAQTNLKDREICLITLENYRDFVKFPDFIQRKIDSGIIKGAHMSDLLRLELLIQYGGTWADATVYFTSDKIPSYIMESDLFLFQSLKPGLNGKCTCISNWFMSGNTNSKILMLTRDLLYEYWRTHNQLIDYFIFHDFFQIAIETYPNEWRKVVPFDNAVPHMLLLRLFDTYNDNVYQGIMGQTAIHKLTYKFSEEKSELENTYFKKLISSMRG